MIHHQLLELYRVASKHSGYQVLPAAVAPLLAGAELATHSRHERERLAYFTSIVNPAGLRCADIGGNTGFFTFELLARGAQRVDYYEGNEPHCEFVRAAATELGCGGRLRTFNRYVRFDPPDISRVECTLLLNVLHHFGDDFGDRASDRNAAKDQIIRCVNGLAPVTSMLVLQLGFNWKGQRDQPLFARGTKAEMIEFVQAGTRSHWDLKAVGAAERRGREIVFADAEPRNLARDDSLGEFLNRPLFLLESRHRPADDGRAGPQDSED